MSTLPKKMQVIEVKQGDTLVLGCAALNAEGDGVDLTDATIRSQVRDEDDELVEELAFAAVNLALGTYELAWPGDGRVDAAPGNYLVDIEYSVDGDTRDLVRSSRTFYLRVLKGVTA